MQVLCEAESSVERRNGAGLTSTPEEARKEHPSGIGEQGDIDIGQGRQKRLRSYNIKPILLTLITKIIAMRESLKQRRTRQDRCCFCLKKGRFPCCCITYKSLCTTFIILDIVQACYFVMIYTFFIFTPQKEVENVMDTLFRLFNPFLKLGLEKEDQDF